MKQPVPGQVKTRLAAEIGDRSATALYEAFQQDLLERTERAGLRRVIVYAPDTDVARRYFERWSDAVDDLQPQRTGSLGKRLSRFFEANLRSGGPVVAIGSDSPTLPVTSIEQAFELLSEHDVVLGPALDGGYYLVGQGRQVPEMFDRIDWSGPHVFQQTIDRLKESSRSLALLPPWYDVDEIEDLDWLKAHLEALHYAGETDLPRQTLALLTSTG